MRVNESAMRWQRWMLVASLLHLAGLLIFNEGFFLTRVELPHKSSCLQVPGLGVEDDKSVPEDGREAGHAARKGEPRGDACWTGKPLFKRAIVVVIDALRYDFAAWQEQVSLKVGERPFENKLSAVRDLLLHRPKNSLLVPFYADPPTTTMQRLKGIVTGGLPTFMEIKDDVASEGIEITEDNFVDLLLSGGFDSASGGSVEAASRNITFMGDDTWTVLFPNQFNRQFPFPSFNVKDLDTVDNGVLKHLLPEMRRPDWGFLVAHFLGVDHCGHRYGPDNEIMSNKLLQMNQAIDDIVREMDGGGFDDTVLLIFGDHGMTEDGNHGGATDKEVGSALFVYSPRPILLGGATVKDADDASLSNGKRTKHSAQYLKAVSDMKVELELLHPGLSHEKERVGSQWLLGRRPSVEQIDLAPTLALLLGLPIPYGSLGSIIPELFFVARYHESDEIANGKDPNQAWLRRYQRLNAAMEVNVAQVMRYLREYGRRAGSQQAVAPATLSKLSLGASKAKASLLESERAFRQRRLSMEEMSEAHRRAYVEYQSILKESSAQGRALWTSFNLRKMAIGIALLFLGLVALLFALWKFGMRTIFCIPGGSVVHRTNAFVQSAASLVAILIQMLTRLSNSYIVAEASAVNFVFLTMCFTMLVSLRKQGASTQLQASGLVCCAASRVQGWLGPLMWYRGQEAMHGDWRTIWFWSSTIAPLIALALALPRLVSLKIPQQSSRTVTSFYFQCALAGMHWILQSQDQDWAGDTLTKHFSLVLVLPRLVYLVAALELAQQARLVFARKSTADHARTIPALIAFGLVVPFLLILGPGSPPVLLLMLVPQLAFIYQVGCDSLASTAWVVTTWSTLSMGLFFATGHESSFNKLHYASPFVGFDEFGYFRGAFMMGANTFGSFLLCILLLPILQPKSRDERFLNSALVSFALIQVLRTAVMVVFVAAERRHLMVWAIFAPKYVFDAVGLF